MDGMDEKIFEFAYRMALADATGQQAYKGQGEGSKTKLRGCSEAKKAVKEYIEAIFNPDGQPDFEKTVDQVEKAFEEFLTEETDGVFTFGNAQKLVNMTAKYMFMATYDRPELRPRFAQCHCPMDSIMVGIVVELVKPREEEFGLKRGWIGSLRKSWSKITKEDRGQYDQFQELVKGLCSGEDSKMMPIEFDFKNWE